jgi:hypothetical protein
MQSQDHRREPPPLLTDIVEKMTGASCRQSTRDHPAFKKPNSASCTIWRYMDFAKFVSMLANRGLFFARVSCLDDVFEGSTPRGDVLRRETLATDHGLERDAYAPLGTYLKWSRQWTFVNCWHINNVESTAMWHLYTKSGEAIAIKSTFGLLDQCLGDHCYIGMVEYLDYGSHIDVIESRDNLATFVHKRKSFAHEKELRALLQDLPTIRRSDGLRAHDIYAEPHDSGRWVPVDLNELVTEVVVAPQGASWFKEVVGDVCDKYGLRKNVRESVIAKDPLW